MTSRLLMRRAMMTVVLVGLAAIARGQQPAIQTGDAMFTVSLRGTRIGSVRTSVTRGADGFTVAGSSEIGEPLNVTVRRVEINYTPDWLPLDATVDLATPSAQVVLHGGFTGGLEDRVEIVNDQRQVVFVTPTVSRDALILPNLSYSAYEALAAWLDGAMPGAQRHAYILPHREVMLRVETMTQERVTIDGKRASVKHFKVSILEPGAPTAVDVWVLQGRLVRLDVPASSLSIRRQDVLAR
ncbi:MAG: hypothetical protein EXQ48_07025 [Acidobacteria bacterium]|nr:hypothetical protein [Acidobacteriota bacterium]